MTKQTEDALKMAIEALEDYPYEHRTAKMDDALQACKEALAQPAQEPVAWKHFDKAYSKACNSSQPQDWMDAALLAQQARNTHPAPSWQGLSDDEIAKVFDDIGVSTTNRKIYRAIEQALKDKNS